MCLTVVLPIFSFPFHRHTNPIYCVLLNYLKNTGIEFFQYSASTSRMWSLNIRFIFNFFNPFNLNIQKLKKAFLLLFLFNLFYFFFRITSFYYVKFPLFFLLVYYHPDYFYVCPSSLHFELLFLQTYPSYLC